MPDYTKAVAEFSKIIGLFESSTDGMIIDQANNPGGSVFYLYALASMLTDKPLKTPRHRMAITQADIQDALDLIKNLEGIKNDEDAKKMGQPSDLDGYPASYELARFALSYARFFVSEWNAGRKLTRPYWIGGVDHINPAPIHYTKPILLLTNHLDFSGGDFFPAILQDNRRITILGSRTAGAGGYVNDVKVPNNIGVNAFRCTESIAERVDGNPIENLGVKPDIEYEMTVDDFTQNYAPYVKAIQTTIASLTK
jgi:C-terminal processing protease CtpA/Prc